jgi:ketosteroid isomerase-like protein
MSQENVETVRSANDAFKRGDIDAVISLCDEEIEIEDVSNAPDVPRVSHGLAQVRAVFKAWLDAFDDFRGDIVESVEVGNRVAYVVDYVGTSQATGLTVRQRVVDVWEGRQVVVLCRSHA